MSGLEPYKHYYVKAYATNSAGTAYGEELSFKTLWDQSQVADMEGNLYGTVQIGDQVWLSENLRSTKYADGNPIPMVEENVAWSQLSKDEKAFCWYANDPANKGNYGALYTWSAAMNSEGSSTMVPSGVQGVCPSGWHLPSDEEWKQLEIFLGMSREEADMEIWRGSDEGGKLKSPGNSIWEEPNTGATNESGFSAFPAGYRNASGNFNLQGCYAVFWTSTENSLQEGWHRNLLCDYSQVYRFYYNKIGGFSVRCMKNE
jgi:uncharacterized protein (TIGR02145 family)